MTIILLLFAVSIMPCRQIRGIYWSHDELIDSAKTIVIVEVEKKQKKFVLRTIKSLKGKGKRNYRLPIMIYDTIHSNDFNSHKDSSFWTTNTGRGLQTTCSPLHYFESGKRYILFPDIWGSMKAAEIMNDTSDLWYKHIAKRLTDSTYQNNTEYIYSRKILKGEWRLDWINIKPPPSYWEKILGSYLTITDSTYKITKVDKDGRTSSIGEDEYILSYGKIILPSRLSVYSYKLDSDTLLIIDDFTEQPDSARYVRVDSK